MSCSGDPLRRWTGSRGERRLALGGIEETLAKGWTASPGRMADLFQWRDGMLMPIQRLYAYASLQSDMDMGNSGFQAMKGQAEDLMTQFDAKVAFMALARAVLEEGEPARERYLRLLRSAAPAHPGASSWGRRAGYS